MANTLANIVPDASEKIVIQNTDELGARLGIEKQNLPEMRAALKVTTKEIENLKIELESAPAATQRKRVEEFIRAREEVQSTVLREATQLKDAIDK